MRFNAITNVVNIEAITGLYFLSNLVLLGWLAYTFKNAKNFLDAEPDNPKSLIDSFWSQRFGWRDHTINSKSVA